MVGSEHSAHGVAILLMERRSLAVLHHAAQQLRSPAAAAAPPHPRSPASAAPARQQDTAVTTGFRDVEGQQILCGQALQTILQVRL